MARACKVCSLDVELKGVVDKQIQDGTTPRQVAQFLTNRGVVITAPSIDRHRRNCLGIESAQLEKSNSEDSYTDTDVIDVETVLNEAKSRFKYQEVGDSLENGVLLSTILLSDILANQLAMLKIAQEKYINGVGGYPKDLFRDLQIISTLQEKVADVYRKRYAVGLKEDTAGE
jgi:hypothetical protein